MTADSQDEPSSEARRVLLKVTGLDGPPVGGGCCAVTREDMLVDELDSWPGLLVLAVDPDAGEVDVLLQPGSTDLLHALEALGDLGLSAHVVSSSPGSPDPR